MRPAPSASPAAVRGAAAPGGTRSATAVLQASIWSSRCSGYMPTTGPPAAARCRRGAQKRWSCGGAAGRGGGRLETLCHLRHGAAGPLQVAAAGGSIGQQRAAAAPHAAAHKREAHPPLTAMRRAIRLQCRLPSVTSSSRWRMYSGRSEGWAHMAASASATSAWVPPTAASAAQGMARCRGMAGRAGRVASHAGPARGDQRHLPARGAALKQCLQPFPAPGQRAPAGAALPCLACPPPATL